LQPRMKAEWYARLSVAIACGCGDTYNREKIHALIKCNDPGILYVEHGDHTESKTRYARAASGLQIVLGQFSERRSQFKAKMHMLSTTQLNRMEHTHPLAVRYASKSETQQKTTRNLFCHDAKKILQEYHCRSMYKQRRKTKLRQLHFALLLLPCPDGEIK
jgi:hypothetical protein